MVTSLFTGVFVFPSEICIIDCKDLSTRDLIGLTDVHLMFWESGISELKSNNCGLVEM